MNETKNKEILRSNGLKVTQARMEILKVLSNIKRPVSIAEIVKKLGQKVDQATVYRVIEVFDKKKIVKQIDLREGKLRYELEGEHHHHLVCKKCNQITAIFDECLAVKSESIMEKYGFRVDDHSLEFFGMCQECAE